MLQKISTNLIKINICNMELYYSYEKLIVIKGKINLFIEMDNDILTRQNIIHKLKILNDFTELNIVQIENLGQFLDNTMLEENKEMIENMLNISKNKK